MFIDCRKGMRIAVTVCVLFMLLAGIALTTGMALAESVYTNEETVSVSFSMDDDIKYKLAQMEKAFPDEKFWNYHDQNKLGNAKQWAVSVNGKTYYVSTKACTGKTRSDHDNWDKVKDNRDICQSNYYRGKSCTGFTYMFYQLLWGEYVNDVTAVYYKDDPNLTELLLPGDAVYTGSHWFIVTERRADGTYEYVDCNGEAGGLCKIDWSHTSSRFEQWISKMPKYKKARVHLHDPEASYRQREELRKEEATKIPRITDSTTGHVYSLYRGSMTWTAARSYAQSLGQGYDLATMDGSSAKEQSIIENLVVDFGHACWLGGTKSSGSWQWVSGVPISGSDSRWDDGEPSGAHSSGSKENYLGIYGNSTQTSYATIRKWNDFQNSSSTIKGFVIEYTPDTSSSTPPTGRLPGDADDNGVVNLNDVQCMLRYIAGELYDINFNNADTNANDQMDMHDVLLLMQYISGWEVPLK